MSNSITFSTLSKNIMRKLKKKIGNFISRINIFDSDDPLMIQSYGGYASDHRILFKGRVLENEGIFEGKSESEIKTLINNFKRFESDEVPGAKVRLHIGHQQFDTLTDNEGYFVLMKLLPILKIWRMIRINGYRLNWNYWNRPLLIFLP